MKITQKHLVSLSIYLLLLFTSVYFFILYVKDESFYVSAFDVICAYKAMEAEAKYMAIFFNTQSFLLLVGKWPWGIFWLSLSL